MTLPEDDDDGPLDAADLDRLLSQIERDSDAMGLSDEADFMTQTIGNGPAAA